jgi:hypothetical protein
VTLQLGEGWLVGRDKGEWGGGLWWFRSDALTPVQILEGNVSYIADSAFGPYAIVEAPRFMHDSMMLAALRRDERGDWLVSSRYEFEREALSLLDRAHEGVYILSDRALLRWNGDSMQTLVSGLEPTRDLGPHALEVDDDAISVSMTLVRLTTAKDGTRPRWFIPSACSSFEIRETTMVWGGFSGKVPECVCTGSRER